jgi:flagellar hook-associated protein 1 FlgK
MSKSIGKKVLLWVSGICLVMFVSVILNLAALGTIKAQNKIISDDIFAYEEMVHSGQVEGAGELEEELAEIMKFQHGYNAAAKFVNVWDSMLDTIINRLGV